MSSLHKQLEAVQHRNDQIKYKNEMSKH